MTQAVNLANFANSLNSSGQVDPAALSSAVAVSKGGTGATTASGARTNLGLAIGTDIPSTTGSGASGTWSINITGNSSTANRAFPRRSDGGDLNFYWSGQSGQPSWLWGGNDGNNMYVYNPSDFSVATSQKLTTASGSAPSYSARAWVNFNGTSPSAIRSSGNVSSITDNATGNYTINFSTAMPDTNYAWTTGAQRNASTNADIKATQDSSCITTTSQLQIRTIDGNLNGLAALTLNVIVFR